MNYVIQYCDGEAKGAIFHSTLVELEIDYRQTLKLPEEPFGRMHVSVCTFTDNLSSFPNTRRDQSDDLKR